jgi:uncharacterized membrane protein HdeD (DUF308 family)
MAIARELIVDVDALASRWGILVARGAAAILFGIVALVWPHISLFALILLWAAYALADGLLDLTLAIRAGRAGKRWGSLLFEGLVGIFAAVMAFVWPHITAVVLLAIIAGWAIVTGVAEVVAAIELRRLIRHEWLMAFAGILSIAFGVFMLLFPGAGALAVITIIAAYAILFGVLMIGLGLRLRSWGTSDTSRPYMTGTPSHA